MHSNRVFDVKPKDRLVRRGMASEPLTGLAGLDAAVSPSALLPVSPTGLLPQLSGFTAPVLVTALSAEIYPADLTRKFIFIQNNDALGIVFVAFGGQGAVLNQGFRLNPAGGSILLDINVPTARIFMIGTIASNPNVTTVIA